MLSVHSSTNGYSIPFRSPYNTEPDNVYKTLDDDARSRATRDYDWLTCSLSLKLLLIALHMRNPNSVRSLRILRSLPIRL